MEKDSPHGIGKTAPSRFPRKQRTHSNHTQFLIFSPYLDLADQIEASLDLLDSDEGTNPRPHSLRRPLRSIRENLTPVARVARRLRPLRRYRTTQSPRRSKRQVN